MILQYIFIEKYRNFENQGFNLSGQFSIAYDRTKKELNISQNPFFIEGFFGESIKDIKVLVGENGAGKSSLLNFIVEELVSPMQAQSPPVGAFAVLYSSEEKQFIVFGYSETFSAIKFKIPGGFRIVKHKLSGRIRNLDLIDSSIKPVKEFQKVAFILLSNIFDSRAFSHAEQSGFPYIIDLTTNSQLTRSYVESTTRSFKTTVNFNSIKFVAGTRSNDFIPSFTLPEKINVTLNLGTIDNLIGRVERNKKNIETSVAKFLAKTLYHNKRERFRYWMYGNLLVELSAVVKERILLRLINRIKESDFLKDDSIFFQELDSIGRKTLIRDESKQPISRNFNWLAFISNYKKLCDHIVMLSEKHDSDNDDFNSFDIPFNENTASEIYELTNLLERSEISVVKASLTWNDLSTGETMLLNFFSNLFVLRTKNIIQQLDTLVFLFDEVDAFYHPQWQKTLVKSLLNFFNHYYSDFNIQIIMTAHSPIIISDIPKSNILFIKKSDGKSVIQEKLNSHIQTFAANVHSLLSDSFFIEGGHIGDFANDRISEVIDLLVDGSLSDLVSRRDHIEKVINIIGEEVIRNKLLDLLKRRLNANLLTMKTDIDKLKAKK